MPFDVTLCFTDGSAGNELCVCALRWTTHARLLQEGYRNTCKEEEPCVLGIGTEPSFAIGQRALLIQTGALPVLPCARVCYCIWKLFGKRRF